jgi:hypothetical protein
LAGETKLLEENPPQCHFVRHKSEMITSDGTQEGADTASFVECLKVFERFDRRHMQG